MYDCLPAIHLHWVLLYYSMTLNKKRVKRIDGLLGEYFKELNVGEEMYAYIFPAWVHHTVCTQHVTIASLCCNSTEAQGKLMSFLCC